MPVAKPELQWVADHLTIFSGEILRACVEREEDLLGIGGKDPVDKARVGILLLKEEGDAGEGRGKAGGGGGVGTSAEDGGGAELF